MGFFKKVMKSITKLPIIGDVLSVVTGSGREPTITAPTTSTEDVAQAAEEERLRRAKARGRASTILMGDSGTEGTTASATLLGG
jgi:hypothetical protein